MIKFVKKIGIYLFKFKISANLTNNTNNFLFNVFLYFSKIQ